ncbi:hypothetical protein ACA910_017809 [Epithemia clementina (nom. ined.)]
MATQSAARKAWNEAMKATAGSAALPPALQNRPHKRRSDRHKKNERRAKARKVDHLSSSHGGGGENDEYRAAVWIDALEGVDPVVTADDDEEYDELNELDGGKKGRKRRGASSKAKAGTLPKKFLPRTLASILIEEAGREDSMAREFIQAEATLDESEQVPSRKFCPVSGLEALYTEPKSGLPYSTLRALEQIRERPPPWMTLGGAAAYMESVKSILDG